jgi:hydrogenase/urease accessory protein HupE
MAFDCARSALASRAAVCVSILVAASVWLAPRAAAHEIGTTRVSISYEPDGGFAVSLSVDAAALLAKLESLAGVPRSGPLPAAEYRQRIEAFRPVLLQHAEVSFDGQPQAVTFDYVPDAAPPDEFSAPGATIHLRGRVPAGARSIGWRYDLTFATYSVTVRHPGTAAPETAWLEGQQARHFTMNHAVPAPSRASIAATYFALGFTHILPGGLDHILFVLGVFLFGRSLRGMLWQVSAFTLAHSITLGLSLYGIVSLPSSVVEPLIALSIVCVAVENIFRTTLTPWRVAVVFGFGLLHGMGFAGALRELGLPRSEFLTGLVTFNAGVEAGQVAVIAAAFALVACWTEDPVRYRKWIVVPGSALIALIGLYWTLARLPLGAPSAVRLFF